MKRIFAALLPALAIAAVGFAFLHSRQSGISKWIASNKPVTEAGGMPLPEMLSASGERTPAPERKEVVTRETAARVAKFFTGLQSKMQPLIEKAQSSAAERRAQFKAGRVALLLDLDAPEKEALRKHLEPLPEKDRTAAARDWILERHGEEAAEKFDAAEAAGRTAAVEHEAQEAIFRLSRIVDLTPEQKDRLFDGFVRKAADADPVEAQPHELQTTFAWQDTPSISHPKLLARPFLTPDQLAFFDAAVAQEQKSASESNAEAMGQLLPALIGALQDSAVEGSTPGHDE
jgi:hypothetical protein